MLAVLGVRFYKVLLSVNSYENRIIHTIFKRWDFEFRGKCEGRNFVSSMRAYCSLNSFNFAVVKIEFKGRFLLLVVRYSKIKLIFTPKTTV